MANATAGEALFRCNRARRRTGRRFVSWVGKSEGVDASEYAVHIPGFLQLKQSLSSVQSELRKVQAES